MSYSPLPLQGLPWVDVVASFRRRRERSTPTRWISPKPSALFMGLTRSRRSCRCGASISASRWAIHRVSRPGKAKQDKAVADLVQYTEDFGAFLSSANPNLPKDVVADLVKTHVLMLKEVIDAQASGDVVQAYSVLRHAAGHMAMIANPLAEAIVKQFPAKYAI
jgi:hypothetical protein